MTYFNYHAQAIKLIQTGHCKGACIEPVHNKISPALILFFDNHKPMPIREDKWIVYTKILSTFGIEIKNGAKNRKNNKK